MVVSCCHRFFVLWGFTAGVIASQRRSNPYTNIFLVIASEAKQSHIKKFISWDCFVVPILSGLLAKTVMTYPPACQSLVRPACAKASAKASG
ncbi:MAG: hypothetical protein V2A69_15645 [Pseudomonadota bacterium]